MYKVTIETSEQPREKNLGCAPLLSELYIKLPKPQSTPRKPIILSPYHDEEWDSPLQYQPAYKQNEYTNNTSLKNDSNCFIFSEAKTKNSSASLPFRSDSEIITDWVRTLFQKKGLLGPKWQQKFKVMRKKQVKQAFLVIKQSIQGPCSAYLQTQSLCKPQIKRINKLLGLGFDKVLQTLPAIINRNRQMAFSKILRFIAFQHLSTKTYRDQQNPALSLQNSLKSSKNHNLNSNFSRQYETNNKNYYSPYNIQSCQQLSFKNQEYESPKTHQALRHFNSLKHLNFKSNEYIVSPGSPASNQQRCFQDQNNMQNVNIIHAFNQEKLVNMRESTKLTATNKNKMVLSDYNQPQGHKPFYVNTNPSSPKLYEHTPLIQSKINHSQHNLVEFQRVSPNKASYNYVSFDNMCQKRARPHSHNPFSSNQMIKETILLQPNQPEKCQNRKSRAISSSPNIKISYIASQSATPNPHKANLKPKVNDYQTDNLTHLNNMHKIGTVQNRQMRKSYQINSFQNQLIGQPQEQLKGLKLNNYAFSSPVSPKPITNMIHMQTLNVSPPSPNTHFTMKSPDQHKQQKNRQNFRHDPSDYYMKKREKLVVISSSKRKL